MEIPKIKTKKVMVLGTDYYKAETVDGNFSAKGYTEKEAVNTIILKILYAENGCPKIKVNNKLWKL